MAEWDEHDIPADEDFFKVEKAKERNISPSALQQRFEFSQIEVEENARESSLSGRLLLVMSTKKALENLVSLWARYKKNPEMQFEHGLGKFKEAFKYLKDVRRWGPEDRIRETGVLESWRESLDCQQDPIRFEAGGFPKRVTPRSSHSALRIEVASSAA